MTLLFVYRKILHSIKNERVQLHETTWMNFTQHNFKQKKLLLLQEAKEYILCYLIYMKLKKLGSTIL